MVKSSKALNYSLRATAGLSTALGIGFIVWGVIVQDPPETALTIGMIILGSLALFVGLFGLLISVMGRCCLSVLLLVAFLVNVGELALTIRLMADLDSSVNSLVENTMNSYKEDVKEAAEDVKNPNRRLFQVRKTKEELTTEFTNDLQYARYIFFVFAVIELILIIVTTVIKIRHPHKDGAVGDEEDQLAAKSTMAQIQMEGLKNSVSQNGNNGDSSNMYSSSRKMYKSVTKKMTQKYGEFTTDPAWSSSGKKWWQSIPGLG
jgi:hypothetical protein